MLDQPSYVSLLAKFFIRFFQLLFYPASTKGTKATAHGAQIAKAFRYLYRLVIDVSIHFDLFEGVSLFFSKVKRLNQFHKLKALRDRQEQTCQSNTDTVVDSTNITHDCQKVLHLSFLVQYLACQTEVYLHGNLCVNITVKVFRFVL